MLFNKKPPPPFKELTHQLEAINSTLYRYLNNKAYVPTEGDLKDIAHMCNLYSTHSAFASYFQIRMNKRSAGESEAQSKYHNPDKAAYYNLK